MRARGLATAAFGLLIAAGPAPAQTPDLASAASDAVATLQNQAQDALLVGDLIGAPAHAPSGEQVGTISNLVALPNGTLVAVLVQPADGGDPLALPYRLVKLGQRAGDAGVTLPDTLEGLRGSDALKNLSSALGGLISGS